MDILSVAGLPAAALLPICAGFRFMVFPVDLNFGDPSGHRVAADCEDPKLQKKLQVPIPIYAAAETELL